MGYLRSMPEVSASYLDDCLRRKVLFFTGKGGVGKSTLAWATALACQRAGARVVLASWSPFTETAPPAWVQQNGVAWERLETLHAFKEYVTKHFPVQPIFNLVFDNRIFRAFVLGAPGLAETIVAGKIWDLVHARTQDLVIVDLPASGHAVSFFHSTVGVQKIFPVGFVHDQTTKILELWKSKECRVDLVGLPEEMPITESLELKEKLLQVLKVNLGYFVVNRCLPQFHLEVPAEVPPELAAVRADYQTRFNEEQAFLNLARKAELPLITLPQLAEQNLQSLLTQLRDQLSVAQPAGGAR